MQDKNNSMDVVTIGEAMLMLVADQPGPLDQVQGFQKRPAGAETNVATGLARLGLNVGWISKLGHDSMAKYLLSSMQSEGIDCSHVQLEPTQRTGFQFKGRVTDGSDPVVEYHRKGSAASQMVPTDLDVEWMTSSRHIHVTGVFPALSLTTLETTRAAMSLMRNAGRSISFDPNLRPSLWATQKLMRETLNELAYEADWVLPGIEEAKFLTGLEKPEDIAAYYIDHGAEAVVVKLGPMGAYYKGKEGSGYVPAFSVSKVVDTVGAGDGFAVGVISALLDGKSLEEAVRRGAWIGARAIQVLGDSEGLPTVDELAAIEL